MAAWLSSIPEAIRLPAARRTSLGAWALLLGVASTLVGCGGWEPGGRAGAGTAQGPRVALEEAVSRYGRLEAVNSRDGGGRVTLNGRTILSTPPGAPSSSFSFEDAAALGEQDVFLIVLTEGGGCRRPSFLQVGPDQRTTRSPFLAGCGNAYLSAVTGRGLTVQINGRQCYDWRDRLSERSCPPLTRADERRARRAATHVSMGCRDPAFRVAAVRGPDSSQASLALQHTQTTARRQCEYLAGYEGVRPTPASLDPCIKRELAETPNLLWAHADCKRRTIKDVAGDSYRYLGRTEELADAWVNTRTGEQMAGRFCASNYAPVTDQFTAMCPAESDFLLLDSDFKHSLRGTGASGDSAASP